MAKKVQEELVPENISVESLDSIMGDKYAVYAKYVIQDRAIPDKQKNVQKLLVMSWDVSIHMATLQFMKL